MDLRDYYDNHWTHVPEGGVDYSRLQYVLDVLEPGERVLDSGCGPGFLAALLAEHGVDVVGTDVSRSGRSGRARAESSAQQVDLDTDPLPFADGDVRRGGRQLQPRASLLHASTRRASACAASGRAASSSGSSRTSGTGATGSGCSAGRFPYIPDSPTDEYHIRYMTALRGQEAAARSRARRASGSAGTPARGFAASIRGCSSTGTRSGTSTGCTSRSCGCGRRCSPAICVSTRSRRPRMKLETLKNPKRSQAAAAAEGQHGGQVRRRTSSSWRHAPTFPDRVYVESTNVCNLDCIMCPTGLHIDTRPKGYMEWDLYTAIIDEIAPLVEAVVLHSWGEPLLHKRIIEMIQYAKDARGLGRDVDERDAADRGGRAPDPRRRPRPDLPEHGRPDEGDVREGARQGGTSSACSATSSASSS